MIFRLEILELIHNILNTRSEVLCLKRVVRRVHERRGSGTYRNEKKVDAQKEKVKPYGTSYFYLREGERRWGRNIGKRNVGG